MIIDYSQGCRILVRDIRTMEPIFDLIFYGIARSQLMSIPMHPDIAADVGGGLVARALKRRGLDPYNFFFTLFDIRDIEASGRGRYR